MTEEKEVDGKKECCDKHEWKNKWHGHRPMFMGGFYGMAFIAAAIYYIQQSDTFWMGVLGFLKALVWPAMLIYKVFTLLQM